MLHLLFADGLGTWAVRSDNGNVRAFLLSDSKTEAALPFRSVYDAWTSRHAVTYISGSAAHGETAVIRFAAGEFRVIPGGGVRLIGMSGESPDADRLFSFHSDDRQHPETRAAAPCWTLQELKAGQESAPVWNQTPVALASAGHGDIYASSRPARGVVEPGQLWRFNRGIGTRLALPATLHAQPYPAGLCVTSRGVLLALIGEAKVGALGAAVEPWLLGADGLWSKIESKTALYPWCLDINCRAVGDEVYVPTERGLFVIDERARIRKVGSFSAWSVWTVSEGLVAVDGEDACYVKRKASWQRLIVEKPKATRVRPEAAERERPPPPFSFARFIGELAGRPNQSAATAVEALFAARLAPDLFAFLSRVGVSTETPARLGLWSLAAEPWQEAHLGSAFAAPLRSAWERTIPSLTNTVTIGKDGSGNRFFAEVHHRSSAIFMHEAESGRLLFFADSLSAFAELNHLMQLLLAHGERHDFDPGDLTAKDVTASATLTAIGRAAARLQGKVNLGSSDDYGAICKLAGKRLRATTASAVAASFARAHWLKYLHFCQPGIDPIEIEQPKTGPADRTAASRVYALWESFFVAPKRLPALLEKNRNDRARIVDATARFLSSPPPPLTALRARIVSATSS